MRERGFSSCVISSLSRVSLEVTWGVSSEDEEPLTCTWVLPSWVLSSRRAVLAAVSFSKVTVADWVSPAGLISRLVILPLWLCISGCCQDCVESEG